MVDGFSPILAISKKGATAIAATVRQLPQIFGLEGLTQIIDQPLDSCVVIISDQEMVSMTKQDHVHRPFTFILSPACTCIVKEL